MTDQITPPGADPANPGAPDHSNPNPGADPNPNPNPNPADPPKSWYDANTWRKEMAGGDEKIAKRLERFADPNKVLQSYLAAEQKITSGEYKRAAKPQNATPEQLSQWRAESGIPEKPEGYEIKIDEKLFMDADADKEFIDNFYKGAHEDEIPKPYVEKILNRLFADRKAQADAMAVQDKEDATESEEALRVHWGNDYLPNMNIMSGMLDGLPQGIKDQLLSARMADGTMLKSNQDMVKALVQLAREINPAATVVPNAGGANTMQSISEEIASIEKFMRTNRDEYYKDTAKQARYDQLLAAQAKLKNKAA